MKTKQILFRKINTAELIECELPPLKENELRVKTEYSTISQGTEKANIMGDPNVNGAGPSAVVFPRACGYASASTVMEVGDNVENFKVGDRVVTTWAFHREINQVNEKQLVKIPDEISFSEASMTLIASFSLAAVRKCHVEIGESVIVMGLGILGQFAVMFARAQGAAPIIAVDPVKERREKALKLGADYALDPTDENFIDKAKEITDGGANVCIEVTGLGKGLEQGLDVMKRFGRVALLGCTRDRNFTIDYYKKVHAPGITMIGAHTMARPSEESHSGWFTHNDDIKAILNMIKLNRINIKQLVGEVHDPKECFEVYTRLIEDKNFPVVQFDWSKL